MRDIKPKKSEDTQNERNALNGHGEFTRICRCLALSEETTQTAWRMHEAVRKRCCLMGDAKVWMVCAIYAQLLTQEDQAVSLTQILDISDVSALDFTLCMRDFLTMAEIQRKVCTRLLRVCNQLSTSLAMFQKLLALYHKTFTVDRPLNRDKCDVNGILEYIWTLFIAVQKIAPDAVKDMMDAYFLLQCVFTTVCTAVIDADIDDIFTNEFVAQVQREDIIGTDYALLTAACSLGADGGQLLLDVKHYYTHTWLSKLKQIELLHYDESAPRMMLTQSVLHNLTSAYEQAVRERCSFNERVFLRSQSATIDDFESTLHSLQVTPTGKRNQNWDAQLAVNMYAQNCLKQLKPVGFDQNRNKSPVRAATGWDGGMLLADSTGTSDVDKFVVAGDHVFAPCSTLDVQRQDRLANLQELLMSLALDTSTTRASTSGQSVRCTLDDAVGCVPLLTVGMTWPPLTLFTDQSAASACRQRLAKMGSVIEAALMTDAAPLHRAQIDTVFYRLLLSVAAKERERVGDSDDVEQLLQASLSTASFQRCIYAIATELVMFTHNVADRTFPWCLQALKTPAWYFFKTIETVVRSETHLAKELVVHLGQCEDRCVDELCWTDDSPLWNYISGDDLSVPYNVAINSSDTSTNATSASTSSSASTAAASRATKRKANVAADAASGATGTTGAPPAKQAAGRAVAGGGQTSSSAGDISASSVDDGAAVPADYLLFVRKMYLLLSLRLSAIANTLHTTDDVRATAWTLVHRAVSAHVSTLLHPDTENTSAIAHLDALLLAAILAAYKYHHKDTADGSGVDYDTLVHAYTRVYGNSSLVRNTHMYSMLGDYCQRTFAQVMRTELTRIDTVWDVVRAGSWESVCVQTTSLVPLLNTRTADTQCPQTVRVGGGMGGECGCTVQPMYDARLGFKGVKVTSAGKVRSLAGTELLRAKAPTQQVFSSSAGAKFVSSAYAHESSEPRSATIVDANSYFIQSRSAAQRHSTQYVVEMEQVDNDDINVQDETPTYVQFLN